MTSLTLKGTPPVLLSCWRLFTSIFKLAFREVIPKLNTITRVTSLKSQGTGLAKKSWSWSTARHDMPSSVWAPGVRQTFTLDSWTSLLILSAKPCTPFPSTRPHRTHSLNPMNGTSQRKWESAVGRRSLIKLSKRRKSEVFQFGFGFSLICRKTLRIELALKTPLLQFHPLHNQQQP